MSTADKMKLNFKCRMWNSFYRNCNLWPWPIDLKCNPIHCYLMSKSIWNMSVIDHKELDLLTGKWNSIYRNCDLWLWSIDLKCNPIKRYLVSNLYVKYEHNRLQGTGVIEQKVEFYL